MRTSIHVLVCGVSGILLLGCGAAPAGPDDTTEGDGGTTGTGSGGTAPAGHGGQGGTAGKSGGTGGKIVSGSGGTPSMNGGSPAEGGTTGGGQGGGGVGSGEGGAAPTPDAGGDDTAVATDAPVVAGGSPYGCTGCKRLFNGVNLDGWDTAPGAWEVKDGVLASKGIQADIYTHEDLGDYRILFQVRHVKAMGGKEHKPCTVMFGKRPGNPTAAARSLGGAQFQPPLGGSWDYGVGGKFTQPNPRPMFDDTKWHQCEVVVREAGSFHAACCPMGDAPCKTLDVLSWKGPGRKHPFDIMMHNGGLFDEYKEIWIELNPVGEALLSQK